MRPDLGPAFVEPGVNSSNAPDDVGVSFSSIAVARMSAISPLSADQQTSGYGPKMTHS
jgi:hypothetical protein